MKNKQTNQMLARVLEIQRELDVRKDLYTELDMLTIQLQSGGFVSTELNGLFIELVDNFAVNNTCFRPTGVKRFEIKVKKAK